MIRILTLLIVAVLSLHAEAASPHERVTIDARIIPALGWLGVPTPPGMGDHVQVLATGLPEGTTRAEVQVVLSIKGETVVLVQQVDASEAGLFAIFPIESAADTVIVEATVLPVEARVE